jgi:hypothetical protein
MIILSVGMPRAGSGWHYNLIHDLMKTTGCDEARDIRERFHLQGILTEMNCNIGVLSLRRLGMVMIPALLGKTFVIKAHSAPTVWSRFSQRLGLLRITYIFRDPRDAMLSAYDYGRRALDKGHPNAFSHLNDFEKTIAFMDDYVRIWEKWMGEKQTLVARYENLLTDYDNEAKRLVEFLGLNESKPEVQDEIARYRPGQAEGRKGVHFYKGKIGRFRKSYTQEEQDILAEHFGPILRKMNYEI